MTGQRGLRKPGREWVSYKGDGVWPDGINLQGSENS